MQVLDVCTLVKPQYWELKEVALFLNAPGSLDPSMALGLYVKSGNSEWLYRGAVHNAHPSEVMPLQVGVDVPCEYVTKIHPHLHQQKRLRIRYSTSTCLQTW